MNNNRKESKIAAMGMTLAICAAMLLLVGPAGAAVVELNPIADSQVASGYPGTNYGDATSLYLNSYTSGYKNERPYLKFDLSGIPDGATINGAELKLWCWKANYADFEGELYQIHDDTWTEMGITWNNQPWNPPTDQFIDSHAMVVGATDWHSWNTANLANWVSANLADDSCSLMLKANPESQSGQYAFESKEWSDSSLWPKLCIDYTTALPDLAIVDKSEEWTSISQKTYNVSYTVKNQGGSNAGPFDVGLYIDGALVTTENIPAGLPANGSCTGNFNNHQVTMSGHTDTVKVCADSGGVITEASETNNCTENDGPGEVVTVTNIVDGDTIDVDYTFPETGGNRIRLIGIDALELGDPRPEYNTLAYDAKSRMETLVLNEEVILERDVELKDSYNRALRYVHVNPHVNKQMIEEGLAQVTTYPPNDMYRAELHQAQRAAKANYRGLWDIVRSDTSLLYPFDDANVAEGYPDDQLGDKTSLYLQSYDSGYMNERIYLKFDLSNVTTSATNATLRLYCWDAAYGTIDAELYEITDDSWTEEYVTWNTQPYPPAGDLIDTVTLSSGATGWHSWNTANLTDWFNANLGDDNLSLLIKANPESTSGRYTFEAREWHEWWPELVVEYPSGLCGDVNKDTNVNMVDVQAVRNHYFNGLLLPDPWAADVNCDTNINMVDVQAVRNHYFNGLQLNCC